MTIPLHSLQTKSFKKPKHNWMKKKEEKNVIPFQQILVSVSVYVRKKNHNEVISMLRPKKTDNYTMFVV